MLTYSINESSILNYNLYRYTGKKMPDISILENEIIQNQADIVILRFPSSCQDELFLLDNLAFNYYLADTLIEYTFKIKDNYIPKRLCDTTNIHYEIVDNVEKLEITKKLLHEIFINYSNHYSSNPFLKTDDSIEIYIKWLDDCFLKNGLIFLCKFKNQYSGFFSGNINNDIFIGGPGGVLPTFEGEGIYLDAHIYLPSILKSKYNINKCRSGTQIQNHVVQKQWSLLNWSLTYSWITVHVNPFIKNSINNGIRKLEIETSEISSSSLLLFFNNKYFKKHIIIKQKIKFLNYNFKNSIFYCISNFIPDQKNLNLYHIQINLLDDDNNYFATISTLMK
jgi:hypothetical protein